MEIEVRLGVSRVKSAAVGRSVAVGAGVWINREYERKCRRSVDGCSGGRIKCCCRQSWRWEWIQRQLRIQVDQEEDTGRNSRPHQDK